MAIAACGGGTPSSTKQATTRTACCGPPSHDVAVDKSVVQPAPGGSRVKVTFVSYDPDVSEATNNALTPKVLGVTLRLQNLGEKPVNANAPTFYSVLYLANTGGANTVQDAGGPCGGSFYTSPLHVAPHASAQGCIPYEYGAVAPVGFGFGFQTPQRWPVSVP